MSLANLKVGARLGLGFGAMIAMMIAIAVLGVNNLRSIQGELDLLIHDKFTKVVLANSMVDGVNIIARAMRNSLLETDKAKIEKELDRIDVNRKAVKENLDKLEAKVHSNTGKALFAAIVDARSKYIDTQATFEKLVKEGKLEEAKVLMLKDIRPMQATYLESINKLIEHQTEEMSTVGDEASRQVQSVILWITVISLIALAIGVVVGFLITRSITRPLQEAVEVAGAVAKGDLTQRIEVKSKDETGQLLQALKGMNESLVGIVAEVRGTTDSITTASQEIAQGNADLSQRTEEQASSLEETASSMEELTSTVRQNTENAKQANQLATNASDIAVKGGKVVGDVVETMASISTSSKKIVDIISVIEGIAFQTNILALNAAVEAARAGEQGRGFAVVAGEVRNLAQRSAAAAKEIKTLIDDSVNKVDVGSKQVDQAGATMTEIVQEVKSVTDIMAEIAAASNEQSAGIEQVNQAIIQMDEVTQQNAALVEEAAAAAEAMQEQAEVLMHAVSTFKLEAGRVTTRAAAAKPAVKHASAPAIVRRQAPAAAPATSARRIAKVKEDKDGDWKEF